MRRIYATLLILCIFGASCATVTPSRFVDAVVQCGERTVDAQLVANVTSCLTGAVAGGYVQCIEVLPWAVDEIICVVAELSQAKAKAINSGQADPQDATILANANAFLKANKVSRK